MSFVSLRTGGLPDRRWFGGGRWVGIAFSIALHTATIAFIIFKKPAEAAYPGGKLYTEEQYVSLDFPAGEVGSATEGSSDEQEHFDAKDSGGSVIAPISGNLPSLDVSGLDTIIGKSFGGEGVFTDSGRSSAFKAFLGKASRSLGGSGVLDVDKIVRGVYRDNAEPGWINREKIEREVSRQYEWWIFAGFRTQDAVVTIELSLDEAGRVIAGKIIASSGNKSLDEFALKEMRTRGEFSPRVRNGIRKKSIVRFDVRFSGN